MSLPLVIASLFYSLQVLTELIVLLHLNIIIKLSFSFSWCRIIIVIISPLLLLLLLKTHWDIWVLNVGDYVDYIDYIARLYSITNCLDSDCRWPILRHSIDFDELVGFFHSPLLFSSHQPTPSSKFDQMLENSLEAFISQYFVLELFSFRWISLYLLFVPIQLINSELNNWEMGQEFNPRTHLFIVINRSLRIVSIVDLIFHYSPLNSTPKSTHETTVNFQVDFNK